MNPDPFQRGNLYTSIEYKVLVFFFNPVSLSQNSSASVCLIFIGRKSKGSNFNQPNNKQTNKNNTYKTVKTRVPPFSLSPIFPRKNRTSQSFTDRRETIMASHGNKSEEEAAISEAPNTPITTIVIIIGTQYYTFSLIYVCVCWSIYFCFLLSGSWLFFAYVVLFMVISGGTSYADRGASFGEQVPAYWGPWLRVSFLFSLCFYFYSFKFWWQSNYFGFKIAKKLESLLLLKSTCGERRFFFFF